jgi:phenylacetate-CoA ligase
MNRTERLQAVIAAAKDHPLYAERLAGVDPGAFTPADLAQIEPVTREEWVAFLKEHPNPPEGTALVHLTPSPLLGWMPEYLTAGDLEAQAEALGAYFRRLGLAGKRVIVAFSYHVFAGGWLFHGGLVEAGLGVLPHGPGEAERAAELARRAGARVLVSNPSFALRLAEAGLKVPFFLAAGEPFTSVPGFRERVEAALGARAYDVFGTSELGLVAGEGSEQDGLVELPLMAVLEVLDPETLRPVPDGGRGELVVTALSRTLMPMVRFRTGDLAEVRYRDGRAVLPRGVIGRVDQMVKVKGVKLYPSELAGVVRRFGIEKYRVVVEKKPSGTDALMLEVVAEDVPEGLAEAVRAATGLRPDRIRPVQGVEGLLEDRR